MRIQKILPTLFLLSFLIVRSQTSNEEISKTIHDFSVSSKNTGVLFLKTSQGKDFLYATGFADKESEQKATVNDLFEIGSASKMFTAIAILQLVEQGKLSLQTNMKELFKNEKYEPLANYKGKNYWDKITVEMLLNHTSGMIDYLNVYEDDEKAMEIFGIEGKVYRPADLIKLAIEHGDANFIPGEKFKYCNTGYVLLGEIISKKTGENWRDYIEKNIFKVAGMEDTYFGSRTPPKEGKIKMTGYYNQHKSFMPPTLAGAAGEIVSNIYDLKRFLIFWQTGKLFQKKETLQMQRTQGYHSMIPDSTDTLLYGYGVMKIAGFYGHGGQTFGFQSFVTYNPETKKAYVIGVNDAAVNPMILFLGVEKITF